jgi:DNA repair exonuclease SbcCD nuclease subunit
MEDGRDPDIFSRFKKVFTGHYHTRSDNGTVYYIGNPYEMFFNDAGDQRGFVVFDTETLKHAYVNNPYSLFDYVYYEDTDIEDFDFDYYAGKIIKVIVRKKSDNVLFDQFITSFYSVGVADLKIIENYSQEVEQEFDVSLENEDTFTLIQRFVEESEIDLNKEKLKFILSEIHKEACELV